MKDPFEISLCKMGEEIGCEFTKIPKLPRESLTWPFSEVSYEVECPHGHLVEFNTGYSCFAPNAWEQWGWCEVCNKRFSRNVTWVKMRLGENGLEYIGSQNIFEYSELTEGFQL